MRDPRIPALRVLTLALLTAWSPFVYSAGLGAIRIQSPLGQPLRAAITLHGDDTAELNAQCIKTRLESADGAVLLNPRSSVIRSAHGTEIQLLTSQNINEPALNLQIDVACGMQLHRAYQLLLDPVVILPQTAPVDQSSAVAGSSRQSRPALLSVASSPMNASTIEKRAARKKDRKQSPKTEVVESQVSVIKPPKMAMAKNLGGKKIARNVLKLSSDEGTQDGSAFSPGLKLSNELSESRDTGDPKQMADLRAAQQRFAAILRDEDPVQNSELQIKLIQAKLQELEQENARIKQQDQERQVEMEGMRRDMFSGRWIAWLILLLLVAASAIGWLFWRLREQSRTPAAFWEKTGSPDVDSDDWDEELLTSAHDTTLIRAAAPDKGDDDLDSVSSDWEKGVPLDDTLALDWAAKQSQIQDASAASAKLVQNENSPVRGSRVPQAAVQGEQKESKSSASQAFAAKSGRPAAAMRTAASADKNDGTPLLQLEEISDLMQEAEFWMLLNDAPRAIEILEPYRAVKQPVSPVPWIYLLDLYHVMKEREKYEELKARIKQVFNTNVPDWSGDAPDVAARSLEDYPHVVETIRQLWEGNQIIPYLEGLLVDEREGAREGFDLSVYREIIHLIGIAREPDIAKRRAKLDIGKPQPRLLSQQVTADPPTTRSDLNDEPSSMDIFDRATSTQATARQVVPKPAVFRPPVPAEFKAPAKSVAQPEKTAEIPPVIAAEQVPDVPVKSVEPGPLTIEPVTAAAPQSAEPPVPAFLMAKQDSSVADEDDLGYVDGPDAADDNGSDDSSEELASDMATKLDLAVAYQEIGEHVGARVLLEEVIQGGSAIQAGKAKAMLKKLLKEIDWL